MESYIFQSPQYIVEIINEPMYSLRSVDNTRSYDKKYVLADRNEPTSRHGILVRVKDKLINTCIVLAEGGITTVHEHTAVILDNYLYVAVGQYLCCLSLPQLELIWHRQVDLATCFGVYFSVENDCLVSHGECDIARITKLGFIEWSVSGKDIFSEGFLLFADQIVAVDFNGEKYRIEMQNGKISLIMA